MFLNTTNRTLRALLEWTFYVFIALFPFIFYIGYLYYGTASRSINLVVIVELLAIVLGFSLLSSKNRISVAKSPTTISLFVFLIVLFISGLQGADFSYSFWSKATRMTGLFYFLHIGVFYLFLTSLFKEEIKLRRFLKVFLISAGIFSVGALLSKDGLGIIFTSKPWTGFTFGNSSFAAMYLYPAFLLCIYYVISLPKESHRWWFKLFPIIFIINPYFINRDLWLGKLDIFHHPLSIIGEAQASSLAVIFSVITLLIIWLISKIKNIKFQKNIIWGSVVVGLILAIISMNSLLSPSGYLQKAYLKQASTARPIVWELSKEAIKDRPLLGWGTDNFDRAFEANYDNTLLEQKNGAEAWFDRAHNIFIDQAVETGYIGTFFYILIYLSIIGSMLYVIFRSKERRDHILASVLIVYFVGHIIELQTAFDTTISYVPLAIMAALSAVLFHKTYRIGREKISEWQLSKGLQYAVGSGLILCFTYLFTIGTIPIVRAENANGLIRDVGTSEKRLKAYPVLFGSPLDPAAFLWRTSSDIQRGISQKPKALEDAKDREGFIKEFNLMIEEYKEYMIKHPQDYRSHLSFANVYIYVRLFEIDHLKEAQTVLDEAIALSPNYPQAYWEKAVAYLYMGKFNLAREWAKKGYDLNPDVEQSQKIIDYIDRSIKTFPEIDLYSFWQI